MSGAIQPKESGPVVNFKTLLEGKRDQLAQLVPKHLTVERLMKVAVGALMKSPNLQKCTPTSLMNCFIGAAEVGLEPGGVLGHAYLVPYGDTATLIIGYRGLIELMRRTGELASIRCVVVHEATLTSGFGAELCALVQEHCFYALERPVVRVAGWDTPYPHAQEWDYFPGPKRVAEGLRLALED